MQHVSGYSNDLVYLNLTNSTALTGFLQAFLSNQKFTLQNKNKVLKEKVETQTYSHSKKMSKKVLASAL